MTIKTAEIARVATSTVIDAGPEAIWSALTEEIGNWWPSDFYAGGVDGQRQFFLEAHPGGRMYEQWDGGGGVLWGTVVCVDPGVRLQVLGSLFPNWGGPSEWFGTWELQPEAGRTQLAFSEESVGSVSASGLTEKEKGWVFLFDALKAYAEGKSGD